MSLSEPQEMLARELSCPICLQLFSDPVVLPCGHNYCRPCIQSAALVEKGSPHCCPECRKQYPGADTLLRNIKLCSIVEGYKATVTAVATAGRPVLCKHCLGEGTPAVKTCLHCEESLCAQHLQRHLAKDWAKRHSLMEAQPAAERSSGCPLHCKPPEYFCGSDNTFLCAACFAEGSHQDHDIKTLETAEVEFRRVLEGQEKEARGRLQMAESLAQRGAGDEAIFKAANDKLGAKALVLLGGMEELVGGYRTRLGGLLEQEQRLLEEDWRESMQRIEEQRSILQQAQQDAAAILRESDHRRFVHLFLEAEPAIKSAARGSVVASGAMPAPLDVKKLSTGARTDHFRSEMGHLLQALLVLLSPLELTFNPSTAHPSLLLSNDLRTVKYSGVRQPRPDHPERFLSAPQVLCTQGFSSGEHMWVVEMGQCMWSVGLSYKSVPRRGDHSRLGHNPVSWRIQWKNRKLTACHASCNVALAETLPPLRVEVALDYEGGTLSLHSIMGRRQHLHTFRATFRETVYPAFSIHSSTPESWITLQS